MGELGLLFPQGTSWIPPSGPSTTLFTDPARFAAVFSGQQQVAYGTQPALTYGTGPGVATSTPTCLDQEHALGVAACISQVAPGEDVRAKCGYGWTSAPLCGDVELPPLGVCNDQAAQLGLAYCELNPGYNGPNPTLNALCWLVKKRPAYYQQWLAKPTCEQLAYLDEIMRQQAQQERGGRTRTPRGDETAEVDDRIFADTGPDRPGGGRIEDLLPEDEELETQEPKTAMYVVGALALAVVGGGLYYVMKKKK